MVKVLADGGGRSRGDVVRALWAGVAILALFAAWGWLRDREVRELSHLPAETRQGLYQRSMANLTSVCVGAEAQRVEAFCREEAERVLRLPECDEACERIARARLANPSR